MYLQSLVLLAQGLTIGMHAAMIITGPTVRPGFQRGEGPGVKCKLIFPEPRAQISPKLKTHCS